MSWYKIKPRKVDTDYAKYIRRIGKCEMCGRSDIGLEAAHYHSRRKESVRFDDDNCSVLGMECHRYFHENPHEYELYMIKKLGKKFDALTIRANTPKKKDDKLTKMYLDAIKKNNIRLNKIIMIPERRIIQIELNK